MLSKELLAALNEQMNQEYFTHIWQWRHTVTKNLMTVCKFYIEQAKRNVSTVKIYDYINDRGEHAILIQLKLLK